MANLIGVSLYLKAIFHIFGKAHNCQFNPSSSSAAEQAESPISDAQASAAVPDLPPSSSSAAEQAQSPISDAQEVINIDEAAGETSPTRSEWEVINVSDDDDAGETSPTRTPNACPICLDPEMENKGQVWTTLCGHLFCAACMDTVIREMSGRGRGFVARGRGVALPIPLQLGIGRGRGRVGKGWGGRESATSSSEDSVACHLGTVASEPRRRRTLWDSYWQSRCSALPWC